MLQDWMEEVAYISVEWFNTDTQRSVHSLVGNKVESIMLQNKCAHLAQIITLNILFSIVMDCND